jgi:hypothetical protein
MTIKTVEQILRPEALQLAASMAGRLCRAGSRNSLSRDTSCQNGHARRHQRWRWREPIHQRYRARMQAKRYVGSGAIPEWTPAEASRSRRRRASQTSPEATHGCQLHTAAFLTLKHLPDVAAASHRQISAGHTAWGHTAWGHSAWGHTGAGHLGGKRPRACSSKRAREDVTGLGTVRRVSSPAVPGGNGREKIGAGDEIRTHDHHVGNVMLYH